jgi:hypothetical protein
MQLPQVVKMTISTLYLIMAAFWFMLGLIKTDPAIDSSNPYLDYILIGLGTLFVAGPIIFMMYGFTLALALPILATVALYYSISTSA